MLLTEIFDKQFHIEWEQELFSKQEKDKVAIIYIENNGEISSRDTKIEVSFNERDIKDLTDKAINIMFFATTDKEIQTIDSTNRNKEQFLIFSAVYQAIKEYLVKYGSDIEYITFAAIKSNKDNRTKLYDTFIKKYASKLGFKLLNKSLIDFREYTYVLKRI